MDILQYHIVDEKYVSPTTLVYTKTLFDLMELMCSEDILSILVKERLISNTSLCTKCGSNMHLRKCKNTTDGVIWSKNFTNGQIAEELGISSVSITDWSNFARDICIRYCEESTNQIGGPGAIVEIDESCIGRTKYGRGLQKVNIWIFGGIERGEGGRAFAKIVEDRKKETLLNVIVENIHPGAVIISDGWASYKMLKKKEVQTVARHVEVPSPILHCRGSIPSKFES